MGPYEALKMRIKQNQCINWYSSFRALLSPHRLFTASKMPWFGIGNSHKLPSLGGSGSPLRQQEQSLIRRVLLEHSQPELHPHPAPCFPWALTVPWQGEQVTFLCLIPPMSAPSGGVSALLTAVSPVTQVGVSYTLATWMQRHWVSLHWGNGQWKAAKWRWRMCPEA